MLGFQKESRAGIQRGATGDSGHPPSFPGGGDSGRGFRTPTKFPQQGIQKGFRTPTGGDSGHPPSFPSRGFRDSGGFRTPTKFPRRFRTPTEIQPPPNSRGDSGHPPKFLGATGIRWSRVVAHREGGGRGFRTPTKFPRRFRGGDSGHPRRFSPHQIPGGIQDTPQVLGRNGNPLVTGRGPAGRRSLRLGCGSLRKSVR